MDVSLLYTLKHGNTECWLVIVPSIKFPPDCGSELVDKAESSCSGKHKVVQEDYPEVAKPLDASKITQEVKICDTCYYKLQCHIYY